MRNETDLAAKSAFGVLCVHFSDVKHHIKSVYPFHLEINLE